MGWSPVGSLVSPICELRALLDISKKRSLDGQVEAGPADQLRSPRQRYICSEALFPVVPPANYVHSK